MTEREKPCASCGGEYDHQMGATIHSVICPEIVAWNTRQPTPAAEDVVEAVARAIQDAHAPGHPINHVSIYQARAAEPAAEEPVSWMYQPINRGTRGSKDAPFCSFEPLPKMNPTYWQETPLYARPATPSNPDRLVEAVWEALKAECCADPRNATKCVMVGKDQLAAALSAAPAQDGGNSL